MQICSTDKQKCTHITHQVSDIYWGGVGWGGQFYLPPLEGGSSKLREGGREEG